MRSIEPFARPTAKGCDGTGECIVKVSVVDLLIKVEPEYVIFSNGRNNTIKIKWEIQTSGYKIDAIEIQDPGTEFPDCGPEGNHYSCKNKHTTLGVYKYKIKVSGQPAVPALDPWMVND